jgi:nucleotide-binding universal stress UspA family protein
VIGARPDAGGLLRADHAEMERILIAADGSPSAAHAVTVGVGLAAAQGAAVTFLHVVAPAFARPGRLAAATLLHPRPYREDELALGAAEDVAREAGVEADVVIVSGAAADEIVSYADTIDADLIVVGSRGHNAVTTVLIGSVSRGVLREARRPVLVARSTATPKTPIAHVPG